MFKLKKPKKIEKINLEKETPIVEEASLAEEQVKPKAKKQWPKILAIVFGILVLLGGLIAFFLVMPVLQLKNDGVLLTTAASEASQEMQNQNLDGAIKKLEETGVHFEEVKSDYRRLVWLKIIPYVSGFYKDGEHFMNAGGYLLESADIAIEALQPYADILGLENEDEENKEGEDGEEKEKTKKAMTTEERLLLMLDTLDKLEPSLDELGGKLQLAQQEVDQINVQRYPEEVAGKKIRSKIVSLVQAIDGTAKVVIEAKPIIAYLKPLLGMPDEKRYLLLFQNDAELRPTGGFLTAYAVLSVHKGNLKALGSYDIYSLDNRFGNRLPAPQPIKDYHKNVFYWHLRDMNLSPDFKESMDVFWENYNKAGGPKVDGIIAIDTQVLVDILEVLGPVGVANWGNFSAENDERCDCPQVFYELELYADKPVGAIKEQRKAVLGPLMHSVLLNVMQSPRKKWPEFFSTFLTSIQEKHLLLYFFDEELQGAVEALNAGGRIKDYEGDYLHINDANFAGAKSNMFIEVAVTQEIEAKSENAIKTVTIDYRNPAPASNCNLEAGELCLNGLYRDWVRLYVPQGSELIEAQGSEIEVRTYEELGKTVFEAFYGDESPLRPEGKAQLVFKYKLPFGVEKGNYNLLIQKQPGTDDYEYTVKLNGQEEYFILQSDKEIRL